MLSWKKEDQDIQGKGLHAEVHKVQRPCGQGMLSDLKKVTVAEWREW